MKVLFLTKFVLIVYFVSSQMTQTTSSGSTSLTAGGGSPSSCGANNFKLVGIATASGSSVTMTPANTSDNNAAMWSCNAFKLDSSFKVTANVIFGSNTALGDGIVFALKTSNLGDRMGKVGGYIGYHNTTTSGTPIAPTGHKSLGVEFDTYNAACSCADENGDSGPLTDCNHAQIVRDGNLRSKVGSQTCLKSDGTSVNDGLSHAICITWVPPTNLAAGGAFTVYLDGRVVASTGDIRPYLGTGSTDVYWGFTAGDGAGTNLNTHIISNATIQIRDARKLALVPSCVILMPVEIIEYKVFRTENQTNKLEWTTITERENNYFSIEKSTDGNNFELIANIDGSGNSTSTKNYEFEDKSDLSEVTYYRLSQTDFNGEKQIIGLQAIVDNEEEYVKIVENPFDNHCKLTFKSRTNKAKKLSIYNASGKLIFDENMQLINGISNHEIDFTNQESGLYLIKVSDEEKSTCYKAIKMKN